LKKRTKDGRSDNEYGTVKLRPAFFSVFVLFASFVVAIILDKVPTRETLHCTIGRLQPKIIIYSPM
jgi:hypothetical protein